MTLKSYLDWERRNIERIGRYQLNHSWKRIGLIVFSVSFVMLFANAFTANNTTWREVSKYLILISLLIISVSKDKVEDERTINLRLKSFTYAFIFGVFLALILPFAEYLVDYFRGKETTISLEEAGGFTVLWTLLATQVICFEVFKRLSQ